MRHFKKKVVKSVELKLVDLPKEGDRIDIDDQYVQELSQSIGEVGLINPILINQEGERFSIVAGCRRFIAVKILKWDKIDAIVTNLNPEEIRIARAIENLQRVDLTIIEEAKVYFDLHNLCKMSWEAIGKKTGKTPSLVKRRCDLLELPENLVTALHEGLISYTVADQLKRLRNKDRIEYLLNFCIENGATQNIVRQWVDEEIATIRQKSGGTGLDGGLINPHDAKPIFLACDLCLSAVELGKERSLRICQDCEKTIRANI